MKNGENLEDNFEVLFDDEIEDLANSFDYKPTQEDIESVMSWATRIRLEHNILTALMEGKTKIIGFKDDYPLLSEED